MNEQSVVSRNPRVVARDLGEGRGAVLLHLDTGAYHGLNPVGNLVWELMDEPRSVAELTAGVRSQVSNAPPQIDADVERFLEGALARDLVRLA